MKRNYFKILFIIFLTTFFGCSERELTDNEAQTKAVKFTNQINKNSIQIFKDWDYISRGNAEVWSKITSTDSDYTCIYLNNNDTLKIIIGLYTNFKKDFPYSINIDTAKYNRAIFLKFDQNKIKVLVTDKNGKDTILNKKTELEKIFRQNNPFKHFDKLSKLKDSLGIIGSVYRPDIGNFIQFYLSPEYVLTYLPEKANMDPEYKDIWIKEFSRGKKIKPNWNLRKLERPIDNG